MIILLGEKKREKCVHFVIKIKIFMCNVLITKVTIANNLKHCRIEKLIIAIYLSANLTRF